MQNLPTAVAQRIPLLSVFSEWSIEMIDANSTRAEVLYQLLFSLVREGHVLPAAVGGLVTSILDRESVGSSAIGKGLAVPHLRTPAVSRMLGAIGVASDGIDFHSLDGLPTKLVFLLLSPIDERERHFELMGRLSALIRDKTLLMFLKARRTPREVYEYLLDLDARARDGQSDVPEPGTTNAGATGNAAQVAFPRSRNVDESAIRCQKP